MKPMTLDVLTAIANDEHLFEKVENSKALTTVIFGRISADEFAQVKKSIEEFTNGLLVVTELDDLESKPAPPGLPGHVAILISDRATPREREAFDLAIADPKQKGIGLKSSLADALNGKVVERLLWKFEQRRLAREKNKAPASAAPPKVIRRPRVDYQTGPDGVIVKYIDGVAQPSQRDLDMAEKKKAPVVKFRPVRGLLVGGPADIYRELRAKLMEKREIDLFEHWQYAKNKTRLPAEVEIVIITSEFIDSDSAERAVGLAKQICVPFVRAPSKWVHMQPHLDRELQKVRRVPLPQQPEKPPADAETDVEVEIGTDVLADFSKSFNEKHSTAVEDDISGLLSKTDAAKILEIGFETFDKLVDSGEIQPKAQRGRNQYFDPKDIEALETRIPDLVQMKGARIVRMREEQKPVALITAPAGDVAKALNRVQALAKEIQGLLGQAFVQTLTIEASSIRIRRIVVTTTEETL